MKSPRSPQNLADYLGIADKIDCPWPEYACPFQVSGDGAVFPFTYCSAANDDICPKCDNSPDWW